MSENKHQMEPKTKRRIAASPTRPFSVNLKFLHWQPLYETEKPFQLFVNIPPEAEDQRTTNLVFEDVALPIQDVRGISNDWNIDEKGFVYRRHETNATLEDFGSRKAVEQIYLPEVEDLLRKELEGVDRVFFFDWRVSLILVHFMQFQLLISLNTENGYSYGRTLQKSKARSSI